MRGIPSKFWILGRTSQLIWVLCMKYCMTYYYYLVEHPGCVMKLRRHTQNSIICVYLGVRREVSIVDGCPSYVSQDWSCTVVLCSTHIPAIRVSVMTDDSEFVVQLWPYSHSAVCNHKSQLILTCRNVTQNPSMTQ